MDTTTLEVVKARLKALKQRVDDTTPPSPEPDAALFWRAYGIGEAITEVNEMLGLIPVVEDEVSE